VREPGRCGRGIHRAGSCDGYADEFAFGAAFRRVVGLGVADARVRTGPWPVRTRGGWSARLGEHVDGAQVAVGDVYLYDLGEGVGIGVGEPVQRLRQRAQPPPDHFVVAAVVAGPVQPGADLCEDARRTGGPRLGRVPRVVVGDERRWFGRVVVPEPEVQP